MALVALVVAFAPVTPQPVAPPRSVSEKSALVGAHGRAPLPERQPFHMISSQRAVTALAVGGLAVLLASGIWSSLIYDEYVNALSYGVSTGDYAGAAARLEPVIAADPSLAIYHQQRGFLLGLAAASGDTSALPGAVAEFERYTALAPDYATGWANLGALYAQTGDYERATAAMRRAVELAPAAPSLADRLSEYEAATTSGQLVLTEPVPNPISLEPDDPFLANINYVQWLSLTIERQFLPQVRYEQ
jgi:tetratricopeptide (TPR) repeat protein